MKGRRVIGLTGGIASGKSSVLVYFKKKGIPTLSADQLAHACVLPGKPVYRQIIRRFGTAFTNPDATLNREKLGRYVFQNATARHALERLVHPCVIRGLKAFIRAHSGTMVLDIPLLYEAKLEKLVDEVIVVYATQQQQLARLVARNGLSRTESLRRIRAQWPLRKKCQRADWVLDNTGALQRLHEQIKILMQPKRDKKA